MTNPIGRDVISAGEETTGRFTAHRGRVTALAQLPAEQGSDLLVTAGKPALGTSSCQDQQHLSVPSAAY